ncbi:hypothetical protein Q0F98_00930 [Paenibacillus amylolyticus]|nr:hypothetical protein Q0F98_00930 [Paenibacillus amylolyticus]
MLHPDLAEIEEYELEDTQLDMGHAAVSRDGRWIAFGSQGSNHMVMDRQLNKTYSLYPESSYPHYAAFTSNNQTVWFNACHFYNGVTIQVPLESIAGNETKEDWPVMDENARVYAAVEIEAGMVLGDAYGYLYCVNGEGEEVWRHFVGSTIYSLAVSLNSPNLQLARMVACCMCSIFVPKRWTSTGSVQALFVSWSDMCCGVEKSLCAGELAF